MVAFIIECKAIMYFLGTVWSIALLALARVAVIEVWKRVGQECTVLAYLYGYQYLVSFNVCCVCVPSNSVSLTLKLATKAKRMLQIRSTDMRLMLFLRLARYCPGTAVCLL